MNAEHEAQSEGTMSDLAQSLREAHQEILDLRSQIAELRWIETALLRRTRELSERVKEQDCLYAMSDCLGDPTKSFNEILQAVADTIPSGFQSPKHTSVALNISGQRFCSRGFRESAHRHTYELSVGRERIGNIQVFLLPPSDSPDSPAFLPEEEHLLRAAAKWIGEMVQRRSDSTQKPKSGQGILYP